MRQPMSSSELAYMPAVEALARFRDRSLSPVDLTEAVLARAEATEPRINALPLRYPEAARMAAREAEARYMGKGPEPGPLRGSVSRSRIPPTSPANRHLPGLC
jgi:Asp-tRNA(Asn)/Glu-tRNA(Gln) amidotransferase A subunit family amidase